MNHLIKQLQITEALAEEILAKDSDIESIVHRKNELERKLRSAQDRWYATDKDLNTRIEKLEKENQDLLEGGFKLNERLVASEGLATKYFEEKEYFRKRLRRLEDRIRRAYSGCFQNGFDDTGNEIQNMFVEYQESEKNRGK